MKIFNINKQIDRPLIFLCGPYFNGVSTTNRRAILRDYIYLNFNKNEKNNQEFLPLIIDHFLTKDNISNKDINIQLIEEIIASISLKTFIFLDTISASAELGLFTNNNSDNKVLVLIPRRKDIINKSNVGQFVRETMLETNSPNVNYYLYNPKITRYAIATDYVVEHYGFINNKVPYRLRKHLEKDEELQCNNDELIFKEIGDYPNKFNCINYTRESNSKFLFYITIKKAFYLISNVLYSKFRKEFEKKLDFELDSRDIRSIIYQLKYSVFISLYQQKKWFFSFNEKLDISINLIIKQEIEIFILHVFSLLKSYHSHGRYKNLSIIATTQDLVVNEDLNIPNIPVNHFNFSEFEIKMINEVVRNKNIYYDNFKIKLKNKVKNLSKYKKYTEKDLKNLHKKIVNKLLKFHDYSSHSYAYRKNRSIKDCVSEHLESSSFIKYDIKKFFKNINRSILIDRINSMFLVGDSFKYQTEIIVDSLLIENHVPLGLVTSPILSDIYMSDFDEFISNKILDTGIVYTRYADDILFSKYQKIEEDEEKLIRDLVSEYLKSKKLKINFDKYRCNNLQNIGDHFKYLGVNIVKKEKNNIMTVGKKYKNEIAKSFLDYISKNNIPDEEKFYNGKRIAGKVGYVKMIEGEKGFKYIVERIERMTSGRVIINGPTLPIND